MASKFSSQKDLTFLVLLGLCGTLLHFFLNGQYGFHRDELDILMNARQLDWGYVAYPPFTPLMARIGLELFGISLQGLRLFSALAQGIVMILAGLMARDMGGSRNAQILSAIAVFIAPAALMSGTLIQYMAFDFLWWVVIAFFFVRLIASDDPRYWLGIGAGIGLGMMNKYTLAFWVAGLIVAVLLSPLRKHLRSKWLWFGVAIAVALFIPNLIWQINHQFISLDFLKAIHERDIQWGRTMNFLPEQLYSSTNPFALIFWTTGLAACVYARSMRRFRPLAWMFLTTFLLFLIFRGRAYYVAPAYVMLYGAGCTWITGWLESKQKFWRRMGIGFLYFLVILGGLAAIIVVKPVAPINSPLWKTTSRLNPEVVEMVGWEDLTKKVSEIYHSIPEIDKPHTMILAANYGEAGALDLLGKSYNLPRIISGANSFWYRGYGDPDPEVVIVVGMDRGYAENFFNACKSEGIVTNRYGVKNEETSRHTNIYICRKTRLPWKEMWKGMLWFQ